jgi:hypothetical protein
MRLVKFISIGAISGALVPFMLIVGLSLSRRDGWFPEPECYLIFLPMAAFVLSITGCIFGFIAFLALKVLRRTVFRASLTSIGVITFLLLPCAGFAYGILLRYTHKEPNACGGIHRKCYLASDSKPEKPEKPGRWKTQIDEAAIVRKYRNTETGELITPLEFERRFPNEGTVCFPPQLRQP